MNSDSQWNQVWFAVNNVVTSENKISIHRDFMCKWAQSVVSYIAIIHELKIDCENLTILKKALKAKF